MRLLLVTVASVGIVAAILLLWYVYCRGQMTMALLDRATKLEGQENWSEAVSYYQRSLVLNPDDTETLLRLVGAYTKQEQTPGRTDRVVKLLYQALGRAPERDDLRRILAEKLLQLGNYSAAEREARLLKKSSAEAPLANKILALSTAAQAVSKDEAAVRESMLALIKASEALPGDAELATRTANLLREHPEAANGLELFQGATPATFADQLMDRLATAEPPSANALVARYVYRSRYQLPQSDSDLKSALKLEPNHVDALLLSAQAAAQQTNQREEAERWLKQVIDVAPGDPRGYFALAELLERNGDRSRAIELLRRGRTATKNHPELGLTLCRTQLAEQDLASAQETLRDVEAEFAAILPLQDAQTRTQIESRLGLVRSQLDLAQDKPLAALQKLQSVRSTLAGSAENEHSAEWIQATGLMAATYGQLGLWDQATDQWQSLVKAMPGDVRIVRAAADAYLAAGEPAQAVACLDQLANLTEPTGDVLLQQARAHLLLQRGRPVAERNWSEFQGALQTARTKAADRWELAFFEFEYLLASAGDGPQPPDGKVGRPANSDARQRAADLLRSAEARFGTDAPFWRSLSQAYQRLGDTAGAARAVGRYAKLEKSAVERIRLEVSLLVSQRKLEEADRKLVAALPSLPPAERRALEPLRVRLLTAANNLNAAQQLVRKLIDAEPANPRLLALGIETCLDNADFRTAEAWESALRERSADGFDWRYLRARRFVASYDRLPENERAELLQLILELRTERPRWYPAAALAGELALRQGDRNRALDELRQAASLGDTRPTTLQQLVTLLYEANRFAEAEELLARLSARQPDDLLLEALSIDQAIVQDRLADAVDIARKSAARFPDDPMRLIWLAILLTRDQHSEEAVGVLRDAMERFPSDLRIQDALIFALIASGQHAEAQRAVEAIAQNEKLPKETRHFIAARGFEALGIPADARTQYEQAVALRPIDIPLRLRFARFLLAQDLEAARVQYENVLKQDPSNYEARQELASLLASSGREEEWAKATQLLEHRVNESVTNSASSDRMRAVLLARQGRTRDQRIANCRAARQLLEDRLASATVAEANINRRILASILEQEASLSGDRSLLFTAREQLRHTIDNKNRSQQDLLNYLGFLLRHATAEATQRSSAASSPAEAQRLREDFLADAESRILDLKVTSNESGESADSLGSLALRIRLLDARGQRAEAVQQLESFIAQNSKAFEASGRKTELFLMAGGLFATLDEHSKAEEWYRQLMGANPNAYVLVVNSLTAQNKHGEALDVCLQISRGEPSPEVAAVIANIARQMSENDPKLPQAIAILETAGSKYPGNLNLLQAEAIMWASRGKYDKAIAASRRVLAQAPHNVLALNNLATLLSEYPNQLAEALQVIDQAMTVAGRQPSLLDTQGTIYLKMGKIPEAIASLEESTAGGALDARYYFHLAAAYHAAARQEDARRALRAARDIGLEQTVLTDDDRKLLSQLE